MTVLLKEWLGTVTWLQWRVSMQSRVLFEYNHSMGDESQSVLRSCSAVRLHAWWEQANQKEVQGRLQLWPGLLCWFVCLFHFCRSRKDTWLVLLSSTTFDLGNCLSPAFWRVWYGQPSRFIRSLYRCNISNIVQHCLAAKQVPVGTNRMNSRAFRLDLRHRQRSENALQVGDPDPCAILGGFGRCQNGSAMPNCLDRHDTYTVH